MEQELLGVFKSTLEAHFPARIGVTRAEYLSTFEGILRDELRDAPALDVAKGNLATYMKLSILALSMAKQHQAYGLSEREIGENIYRTADEYFKRSAFQAWIQRALFFSAVNKRQIKAREDATSRSATGVNGFKLRMIEGTARDGFGVDYLSCGVCDYFRRKGMFEYVKYLCLVDYAIMKNIGVSFSRTMTLGNGGSKCDFRFSQTGPITSGWPPDSLGEFQP